MTSARIASPPPDIDAEARIAALEGIVRDLRARVEQLEAGRGPRDRWDAGVIAQLGLHFSEPFCTNAAFALASVTPALGDALDAAMIDNPIALGRMLGRAAGVPVGQWIVMREATTRDGALWSVKMRESSPRGDTALDSVT